MLPLPFAMPRKVADVFIVMKGEVPDGIFKNNNTTAELGYSASTTRSNSKKKEAAYNHHTFGK